jgi:phospholipase C
MQENQAFDHFFGVFPGLSASYSDPLYACIPKSVSKPSAGCVKPYNGDSQSNTIQMRDSLLHDWTEAWGDYNSGKMNGFVSTQHGMPVPSAAMSYFTGKTLPDYWDLASYYSLDANFFSSAMSYTYPNHLYLVSAQTYPKCTINICTSNDLTFPTIVNQLQSNGISWNYYANDYSLSQQCKTITNSGYLNVLTDFPAVQLNPATCHKIVNLNMLWTNLRSCNLANVVWITPSVTVSDHPNQGTLPNGQMYVSKILDMIGGCSSLWKSSAIFLAWDDWGGYYDNVVPKSVDQYGYGFRVPMIMISPYVKQHTIAYGVNNVQEDFSSFLTTIEYNWYLNPVALRDGSEYNLFYNFNFAQAPIQPLILPTNGLATYPLSSCTVCKYGPAIPDSSLNPLPPAPVNLTFAQWQIALYTSDGDPLD